MKTQTVARLPIIPPLVVVAHDDGDVTVSATFHPTDPIGSTEVVITPDPTDAARVLTALDAAITRLFAYRLGYQAALDKDAAPQPRAPWPRW